MYTISVQNATGEYTLHNPYDEKLKVINPVLSLELNKSGTLTFTISPENVNRSQILPLASEIVVRRNDTIYWIGRPIEIEQGFNTLDVVTCEGVLGYLLDTQIPPFDFTGNNSIPGSDCIRNFLVRLIGRHNDGLSTSWVDSRKKFSTGTVTITDSNNNLARSSEDYHSVLELINEKLLESYGGYLRVRYNSTGSVRYVDYIDSFGTSSQPISFGDNLLDLTAHIKTEEIATNIIPLGAVKENSDERLTLDGYTPTTADRNRISTFTHGGGIRNVRQFNAFKACTEIYDKAGEDTHGRIDTCVVWDDVTLQRNLALKAAEYIGTVSVLGKTLELSAVDLAQIDIDYNSFNLGEYATVVSIPHGVNAAYQITQMTIDLYNPANSTLTLGGAMRTFTFDNTKKIADVVVKTEDNMSEAIQNATALITGGLGGYVVLKPNERGQTEEILIMDSPDKDTAVNVIRMNKNGIGFSKTGYNGPFYSAWTIGGAFNASYITTGTLSANRIKAGVLADTTGNTSLNMTTGVFTMKKGSINLGGGKFIVTDTGALTANNVNIGGFKLTNAVDNSYALYHDKGVFRTWIRGAVDGASTWVFSAQKKISGRYEGLFIVTADGSLQCRPNNGGRLLDVDTTRAHMQYSDTRYLNLNATRTRLQYSGTRYLNLDSTEALLQYSDSRWIHMDSNRIRIESSNTQIGNLPFSSHYGNMYVGDNFRLYLGHEGSSSRTIKHDIKPVENDELKPERLYDLEVIQFKYNDGLFVDGDPAYGKDHIGFILEDMAEVYPNAVNMDGDEPKNWNWSPHKMIPPMVQLIKDQKQEIDDLKERVEKLEQLLLKGEKHG